MKSFAQKVLQIVRTIPSGKVMSYGQIALYLGDPSISQDVGRAMHNLGQEPDFPWWRVLNNAGKISIPEKPTATPQMQQHFLEAEGVLFAEPFLLDINQYRYRPDRATLMNWNVHPDTIETALGKYNDANVTPKLGL